MPGNETLGEGVSALSLDLLAERIDTERKLREAHEEAANVALHTAQDTLERRLEGMNEFRAQLGEQSRTFITNSIFDSKIDALDKRVTTLERLIERQAGAISTWRFLAGGGGVLGLVSIALWLAHPGG